MPLPDEPRKVPFLRSRRVELQSGAVRQALLSWHLQIEFFDAAMVLGVKTRGQSAVTTEGSLASTSSNSEIDWPTIRMRNIGLLTSFSRHKLINTSLHRPFGP